MSPCPQLRVSASEVCPQSGARHFPAAPERCAAFLFVRIGAVAHLSEHGKRPAPPICLLPVAIPSVPRHSKHIASDQRYRRFSSLSDLFTLRHRDSCPPAPFCAARLKRSFSVTAFLSNGINSLVPQPEPRHAYWGRMKVNGNQAHLEEGAVCGKSPARNKPTNPKKTKGEAGETNPPGRPTIPPWQPAIPPDTYNFRLKKSSAALYARSHDSCRRKP